MTMALSLKVNDGVVLAADSASTLVTQGPDGSEGVLNVYNNADKVFRLADNLPLGAITWGAGNIGAASIATISKDLRRRLSGRDHNHGDWELQPEGYTVRGVAEQLRRYLYDELYVPVYGALPPEAQPALGLVVAGYSAGEGMAEEYLIEIENGQARDPTPLHPGEETGFSWYGQPQAVTRLVKGFDPILPLILQEAGISSEQMGQIGQMIEEISPPLLPAPMPIQDAIALAEFLVDVTIKFSRYTPGPSTVGGPIEIAAITKHEGFKWIKRKHYFTAELNPEVRKWAPQR